MKKAFYIIVFFMVAAGIVYMTKNIDPRRKITIEELNSVINNTIDKSGGEKLLSSLRDFKDESQTLLDGNKLLAFISTGKGLSGKAMELYYDILYSSYKQNNTKFIKLSSGLNPDELNNLFNSFAGRYSDKSMLVTDIQETLKDRTLSSEQEEKLTRLLFQLKGK